ncbi:hypothetical protein [Nocardioides kribbensis]|uniref:Uncharacterized protein n=1 Tax=Nocardioides kribbensis TaxID=305517 RepID=A0ABV1NZ19_9ACTN
MSDEVLLARWLEAEGATLREVIFAIEEPHKWAQEIAAAKLLFECLAKEGN